MKPSKTIILAAVLGVCALIGVAGAQIYLNPIAVVDVRSQGVALHYFNTSGPKAAYLNFKNGADAVINSTTKALDIGNHAAVQNTDGGYLVEPGGAMIGAPGAKRPTCAAAVRGLFYTSLPDAGVKDTTFQCCRAADGTTYAWTAVACQ